LFLNDLFLNRYAILFNQWEAGKVSSDPEYKPAIVVSSYLISELSGHKLGDPTIAYKKFRRFSLSRTIPHTDELCMVLSLAS
jgi:hypothetical protein